jgi:hypothetical protein
LFVLGIAAAFAAGVGGNAMRLGRDRDSDCARAAAHEALLAYATARSIDEFVGPGYLPCPDLDDDGWAESTCGSLDGRIGQAQRLGRLPWKTLGIEELRDGHGEPLWYAVSTRHKGLLNCAASPGCVDMAPSTALGTLTVRDTSGALVHDGRNDDPARAGSGGAAAVVIAAGPPLERREDLAGVVRRMQSRATAPARLDPANYLDKAPGAAIGGEDNAAFVDRTDAAGRALSGDGFIRGPVRLADGAVAVNDRIAVVGYDDLMPRAMRRVASEVAQCLREKALAPRADCGVPDDAIRECRLASADAPGWWTPWRSHVAYAPTPEGAAVLVSREPASCGDAAASVARREARRLDLAVAFP